MPTPVPCFYYPREANHSPHLWTTYATTRRVAWRCLSYTPIGIPPVKLKLGLP